MLLFIAYTLALLGFALLAMSQLRHLERVLQAKPRALGHVRQRRILGYAALGLSLASCIGSEGASFGSLLWVMLISASAMALAFTLSWRPHWLKPLLKFMQF